MATNVNFFIYGQYLLIVLLEYNIFSRDWIRIQLRVVMIIISIKRVIQRDIVTCAKI